MPAVALTSSLPVEIDGISHRIVGQPRPDRIYLVRNDTQEISEISQSELMSKLNTGRASIKSVRAGSAAQNRRISAKLKEEIASLPDKTQKELMRRLAYVKAVIAYMPIPKTEERLVPIIADVAARIGDTTPPHWSTVCRWLTDYRSAGEDPRALVPSYTKRGNRTPRLQAEVFEILKTALEERYLNIHGGTPQAVLDYAIVEIANRNKFKLEHEQLEVPDIRTVYRLIDALDPFVKVAARQGKAAAKKLFTLVGEGPKPTRPLERVEIDHTVLDLFLIDEETGLPIGRPTITLAIDCYSRMPIGFYIGYEPPSWLSVLHCLRHAIMPKDNLRRMIPSIKNDWQCCGVMETIVVDNGREFHSSDLELACEQLGIEILYAPRKKAWFKGRVERIFGTVNHRLLAGTPGRTLSKLMKNEDYDPAKHATVGLAQFREGFTKWVVDAYAHEFHSGLNDIPAKAWKEGLEAHPGIRVPTCAEDLAVVLASADNRVIHHYGIEFEGLKYKCDALGELRTRLYRGKNPKVDIRYDPSDLGQIYVRDPDHGGYITVPATDYLYAEGLSLLQQKTIRRWRSRQIKKGRKDLTRAQAREEIRAILSEARTRRMPSGSSKRAARYLEEPQERQNTEPPAELTSPADDANINQEYLEFLEDEDEWEICSNNTYPD